MKKIKLGFLTVLGNDDNHSLMMGGVFEAAEKYNASVIRFAVRGFSYDYGKENSELNNIYHVIEAQKLDGLMFLGWMPGVVGPFFDEFLKRFSSIPVVSVGAAHSEVPSVFAASKGKIVDLLEHLILVHGYKNIAFVPPIYPDSRMSTYMEVMQKHGIFNEDLMISSSDLENVPFLERMKRVTQILLDERKMKVDAFYLLFDTDVQCLYAVLKSRGINIPGDIAVVSNEDSEFANYAIPPVTSVTFPWREIGYNGCHKLIQIIRREDNQGSLGIPGKFLVRSSCGCRSSSVRLTGIENREDYVPFSGKTNYRRILLFSKQLFDAFPYTQLDIEALLLSLVQDFEESTASCFFTEFEGQLQKIVSKYPYRSIIDEIEDFLYYLRNKVISYIYQDSAAMILMGDIILKSMVVLRENILSIIGSETVEMKAVDHELHYLGQDLSSTSSLEKLTDVLANNLHKIRIPSCYVFMTENDSFDQFSVILEYSDGRREINPDKNVIPGYISDGIIEKHPALLCQLLHVEDEYFGFVVFEPCLPDARIYETLTLHISSGLKSALLLEKLSQEIALRKEKETQLIHNANYDSLTDLYNRRYFIRTLNFMLERDALKPGDERRFFLVFIDFDDFKQVNDRYGHDTGDQLIIEISKKFKNLIRRYSCHIPEELLDTSDNPLSEAIFRIGGDEFTAIVSGISKEKMCGLAAELVKTVNSPYIIEGNKICISCSIGISVYPDQSRNADELIKCADTAMYRAKTTKNMYYFSEE